VNKNSLKISSILGLLYQLIVISNSSVHISKFKTNYSQCNCSLVFNITSVDAQCHHLVPECIKVRALRRPDVGFNEIRNIFFQKGNCDCIDETAYHIMVRLSPSKLPLSMGDLDPI